MRLYSFGNMYLLGIQAGIQCQHCTADLLLKYKLLQNSLPAQSVMAFDWADEHKTTILLNGGMDKDLKDLVELFGETDNPYPWEFFNESTEALNNALTNVSIILPEKMYMYNKLVAEAHAEVSEDGRLVEVFREDDGNGGYSPGFVGYRYTDWELKVIAIMNSKRLMS